MLTVSEEAIRIHDTGRTGGETGDYYYLFFVQTARIGALTGYGRYREAVTELQGLLARAEATANRTAVLQATLIRGVCEIALDATHESRPRLDAERSELPRHGIGILHVLHLIAVMRVAAYTFDFDWALGVMDQLWEPCMRSPLRQGAVLRSFFTFLSRATFAQSLRSARPAW
jgi:hypothetical protein